MNEVLTTMKKEIPQFDRELVSKIIEVLSNEDPYYLQLAYTELKLQGQLDKNQKVIEIETRLEKLENNHIKHIMEDVYILGVKVEKLREMYEKRK